MDNSILAEDKKNSDASARTLVRRRQHDVHGRAPALPSTSRTTFEGSSSSGVLFGTFSVWHGWDRFTLCDRLLNERVDMTDKDTRHVMGISEHEVWEKSGMRE